VYAPDNKCLAFCQIKDLDLYSNRLACAVQHY
jgi:hypothetical protein